MPTAYFIARTPVRQRNLLLLAVVVPFWTSFLIRIYAWIGILSQEGLLNQFLDDIGDPIVGWHFDIGNVLRYGWPEQWIKALGKRIELATSDTAEPAQQCMQAFLGPRYGSTVARVVSKDAGKEYAIDPTKASAEVSTANVLAEGAGGITGAVILLVRRQLANMASRVGARIVGSVLSRVVASVAGGVGIVLIAKDIWDFRNGVLPIIATEMKSRDTKDKVQVELASAIKEQIGENLKEISAKTADRVVDIWRDFRRAHAKVLELADAHPAFKAFIERDSKKWGAIIEKVGIKID